MKAGNYLFIKDRILVSLKYVIATFWAILALFPLLWIVLNSFKTNKEIYASPFALPASFDFGNFINAWKTASIGTYFFNSIFISFTAIGLMLVLAAMSSYYIARITKNNKIYTYFTFGIMVPIHAMLIPTFIQLRTVSLLNTRIGLIIIYCVVNLSMSIFILVGFMRDIPKELEESAQIDGANIYQVFWKVIVPISKPGIATIGTLAFLNVWNDFLYAQVLISKPTFKTLTQGIQNLKGQYGTDYGLMSAGLVICMIPVIIIYILFQEQVVKGMTAGAVKG